MNPAMARDLYAGGTMLRRLGDLARVVGVAEPEARRAASSRSDLVEMLEDPPAGGIDLTDLRAMTGASDDGASRFLAEPDPRFDRRPDLQGQPAGVERLGPEAGRRGNRAGLAGRLEVEAACTPSPAALNAVASSGRRPVGWRP